MNNQKIDDLMGDIVILVGTANPDEPSKALDMLDQAKAKMQELYRLIWDKTYVSGKP